MARLRRRVCAPALRRLCGWRRYEGGELWEGIERRAAGRIRRERPIDAVVAAVPTALKLGAAAVRLERAHGLKQVREVLRHELVGREEDIKLDEGLRLRGAARRGRGARNLARPLVRHVPLGRPQLLARRQRPRVGDDGQPRRPAREFTLPELDDRRWGRRRGACKWTRLDGTQHAEEQ